MIKSLGELRPVYVVGAGFHPYQYMSETSYVQLGLVAVRQALADAGLEWGSVDSAYVAKALLPMAPGRPIFRHLGDHGLPITHIENASASGSAAFRQACVEVAAGLADVSMVLGVDKPAMVGRAEALAGIPSLAADAIVPFTHFALLADEYCQRYGATAEDLARVAVKNHRNAALNPNAQRRKPRSLEEIMAADAIAGDLTSLQCTPVGEGAAAVLIASEDGIKNLGLDAGRAVRVASSVGRSQHLYPSESGFDAPLTEETAALALQQAGINAQALDVVELHDAFTVEELQYVERMGLCGEGQAVSCLKSGDFDIGGRCAVNSSGGLIGMGHPVGPTGVGQIGELTMQLRGEAGERQQPNARWGMAHMVGVGAVCFVSVLER